MLKVQKNPNVSQSNRNSGIRFNISYLLRRTRIHCAVPQAVYSSSTLQPLPSHSSTNSRRRTASPAAYRISFRVLLSNSSRLDCICFSPSRRFSGNQRFSPGAKPRRGAITLKHCIVNTCAFSLQVKISGSLACFYCGCISRISTFLPAVLQSLENIVPVPSLKFTKMRENSTSKTRSSPQVIQVLFFCQLMDRCAIGAKSLRRKNRNAATCKAEVVHTE